jgi:O-antigen/teichoic acid export membrane protein
MLKRPLGNKLARNTLWMSLGQGLKLFIQALYFTLIARSLGAHNYGSFVGVVALVGILYPFGALGSGNLLVKAVARDKEEFSSAWGRALIIASTCSLVFIGIAVLVSHFILPAAIPPRLVFLVAISDILGLSLITISSQAFQSFELLHWTAGINVLYSLSRLLGAIVLFAWHHHATALEWGYLYLGCTTLTVAVSSILVWLKLGAPHFRVAGTRAAAREGFYFSVGLSAQTVYNDIDKTMLARLGSLGATGIYGAAYRLIDVSFAPILALLYSAYPNFFRAGASGIFSSLSYAKPLLLRAACYALFISILILTCAGIVPILLGSDFAATADALRWLSPLPVLKAIHYFLSDSLTGAGHQALRSGIQASVAAFNIAINFWLIPAYSWRGAAWASIASDALLVASIAVAVAILSRAQRTTALPASL